MNLKPGECPRAGVAVHREAGSLPPRPRCGGCDDWMIVLSRGEFKSQSQTRDLSTLSAIGGGTSTVLKVQPRGYPGTAPEWELGKATTGHPE